MLKALLLSLAEDTIRWISGPLGVALRRSYYSKRLKSCGRGLVVSPGVSLEGAEWISLGDHVWLDRQVTLIAGPPPQGGIVNRQPGSIPEGEISIGSHSHLGIGTVIQGHGGVEAGAYFTTSAGVKIYSFSNDPRRCRAGTLRTGTSAPYYVSAPVVLGDNVWLGLNVAAIGARIGADSFARPGAVVTSSFPANSLIDGNPGQRIGDRFTDLVET